MNGLFDNAPVPPRAVELRDYQTAAVDALFAWFDAGKGNPLVVLPTGSGKSLVCAAFAHAALECAPKTRVLVLTHVRELVEQNHAAMLRAWPGAPAGVCSAGLGRKEWDAPILFAGVQTTWQHAKKLGWVDLVVIDEAHLVGYRDSGMYRVLLQDLRALNANLKVIGLTATPFRTGEGRLDGDGGLFDGVAYTADLAQLIKDGWLSPLVTKGTKQAIPTAGVKKVAGEFAEGDLQRAAMGGDLVPAGVAEVVARAQDRRSWLVFCCGIDHANAVAHQLAAVHGIPCATVFGETDPGERDEAIAMFRSGELRALVNVNVLTTGFDAPGVDLLVMMRPTCSPVLYVQMVGRGLRRAPGKTDCLVLDFGGNMLRHGPIDCVEVRAPQKGELGVFARECPNCQTLVAINVGVCPTCGFEFAVLAGENVPDVDKRPDEESMLVAGMHPTGGIERWPVRVVRYFRHERAGSGKPPSMCVEYDCGVHRKARVWVCLEHAPGSYPMRKAHRWWRENVVAQLAGDPAGVERMRAADAMPATVDVAMAVLETLRMPNSTLPLRLADPLSITVDVRGEFPEVLAVRFELEPGEDLGEAAPTTEIDHEQIPF
jgi:DNA repair protein RadD